MKILVAQTIFLGDLIMTLPLIQLLKKKIPEAQIDVLVNARYDNILHNQPAITEIILFDKEGKHRGIRGLQKISNEVKRRNYDIAIILPGSVRTVLAVYLAGIRQRIGTDQSTGMLLFLDLIKFPQKVNESFSNLMILWLEKLWKLLGGKHSFISVFLTDVVPLDRTLHATQRYCQLLQPLGITSYEVNPPLVYPDAADKKTVDELLRAYRANSICIAIAPGSVWKTKRWHNNSFAALMKRLYERNSDTVFFLIGGKEDRILCDAILAASGLSCAVNCCGLLTPLQSTELLKRCSVLITNDTAPMHLASAVKTQCVALFGPTVPSFGFTPLGDKHIIIEKKSLWCRPCTPHGGQVCPIGTHECMNSISVDEVYNAVITIVSHREGGE